MPIKDILLAVGSAQERSAFAAADMLSKRWGAHTTSMQLIERPDIGFAATGLDASVWASVMQAVRLRAEGERDGIARLLAGFETPTETTQAETTLDGWARAVALRAMHADLTIVERREDAASITAFFAALFQSGRPLLLTPPDWSGRALGKRIMVAWNATREAARALADAEPFLREADTVSVVAVDASPAYKGDTFAGYDVSTHLARHGLNVWLRQVDSFGRTADQALLDEARDLDADMIVMGGYGHSRLRELMLGGVTREITKHAPVPVLLSH